MKSEDLAPDPFHHPGHLGVVTSGVAAAQAPAGDPRQHEPPVRPLNHEGSSTVSLTGVSGAVG